MNLFCFAVPWVFYLASLPLHKAKWVQLNGKTLQVLKNSLVSCPTWLKNLGRTLMIICHWPWCPKALNSLDGTQGTKLLFIKNMIKKKSFIHYNGSLRVDIHATFPRRRKDCDVKTNELKVRFCHNFKQTYIFLLWNWKF